MTVADDSKSKILKAGLILFGTKGYSSTTTKEIAKQSGLSEGTLFNHFNDKPTIYRQVIETYIDQPVTELDSVDSRLRYRDIAADLRELALSYIEAIFSHIHILRIVMLNKTNASPLSPRKQLNALLKICDHFGAYLSRMAEKGLIPKKDYHIEIDLFVSHLSRIVLHTAAGENTLALTKELRDSLSAEVSEMCPRIARELFQS
jgi:Transcriptional regulator